MTTFSVGLKPNRFQKAVLNEMIRVTNYAYNWCLYLVNEMRVEPSQFALQKIVCKTHSKDVDPIYRLENDEWFFDNKLSAVKVTACKKFCTSYKSAKARKFALKTKRTDNIREGQIGIQKLYIRSMNDKDKCTGSRAKHIVIMKGNFKAPIRVNKRVDKMPPFERDFKIVKRSNGKFVLQLPCDPIWTRRDSSDDDFQKSVCGIDPGGRTFATVYDPINTAAYQVGLEDDKKFDLMPIHDKIDETH